MEPDFAPITSARERWTTEANLPRHRHANSYICVVVAGAFDEAGDCGRRLVRAGDANCHGAFDAHCDRFTATGAETINFNLPDSADLPTVFCRVRDPDLIVRTAERDYEEARQLLLASLEPIRTSARDWPDELARDLREQPGTCLTEWAERNGIAPATLSRGFRRAYEVSPSTFRAQLRARQAWRSLLHGDLPLSAVAAEHGFSDQPHMTRAVRALTGRPPLHWRRIRSSAFKTRADAKGTLVPWTSTLGATQLPSLAPC